ncbi:PLP-dependent aminotransferase family protein [Anaerotruncus rubiinfantis]|uniref:PLP-dependent aminotransferase family protein n=1 Tax=Anaerotruncus rubiinfantis TaxID=1720200 RepID=UPI0034A5BF7C
MHTKFAKRVGQIKSSEIREILKVTERPEVISFAGGLPAPELFPVEEMRAACDAVLKESGEQALQYGITQGKPALRQWIAKRMNGKGIKTDADGVMVLTGSQQGLDLTGKVFIDEGDVILTESPTYLAAINAFKAYSPRFVSAEMDEEGMIMESLEEVLKKEPVKLIYTVSDFQNPTGRTMSLERRKKIVELANRYNVIIVEDNPYGELRFAGEAVPPIKSFDTEGRVIYLSTFSKIFAPGLRLGWLCASPEILQKYIVFKEGSDLHTDTFSQMIAARYLQDFDIEKHIEEIRKVYGSRRNLMLKTMEETFPEGVKFTHPEGGLFLWVEMPEGINSRDVFAECMKEDIAFVPGEPFFTNGKGQNTFRLNFSNMPEERIVEGITKMGKVLTRVIKG